MLSIIQFAYNVITIKIIKISSFYANYEYNSNIIKTKTTKTRTQAVEIFVTQLKDLQQEFSGDLKFLSTRTTQYYDKKRFEKIVFKMKNKVGLLRKNIKTARKSNKLNHVKIESFEILRNIKNINFELKLLKTMKLKHFVFHAFLLKSANFNIPKNDIPEKYVDEKKYIVENILNKQKISDKYYYLMKGKSYKHEKNTGKFKKHLKNTRTLLKKYHRKNSNSKVQRINRSRK